MTDDRIEADTATGQSRTLDVFALRERVVGEYRDYVESFIHILDKRVEGYIREKLAEGELWPQAVLQLNPAYQRGRTLGELADRGTLSRGVARFFGEGLRLYRHQEEAIEAYRRREPYIVSTGTGSGKSLTYLVPIFDQVLRDQPERHTVRAIIVYPMNALINSQIEALEANRQKNWPDCPVRFARYTGQDREEGRRIEILEDPPHILLTNYVMLEYMLIRPAERPLFHQATRDLSFVVMDEVHFYRGRQGADVSMLMRRVRQRAARPDLICVGTSATLVTEGDREARRRRIAEVGSRLFGVAVARENVIDESLERVARVPVPAGAEALRAAVEAEPPAPDLDSIVRHPLVAWVEETFGLASEGDRLVRRRPIAFKKGVQKLHEQSGVPEETCRERLKALLEAGSVTPSLTGEPILAFRLHQFLASGGSVYTTLEPPDRRQLSTEGQFYAPGGPAEGERVLFPLAFCRICGQDYYLASLADEGGELILRPRSPLLNASEDETPGEPGYFALEHDGLWTRDEDLPDNWMEERKGGPQVKARYRPYVPRAYHVKADGHIAPGEGADAVEGWWQPTPFMLCLRCRAAYDLRETGDFRKLVTLSQTGRSTATTVVGSAGVVALREDPAVPPEARKILSFTDNRQDASLQAGHLNDFAQVVLLRGALVRALGTAGELTFDRIGSAIFEALALDPAHYMLEPVPGGPGFEQARTVMTDLLEYRAIEDLARAWRVAQPNLEQCGLLRIDYHGLSELAADDALWASAPLVAGARPEQREQILRAVLDHLRSVLAIDARTLTEDWTRSLARRVHQAIREPWALDERDRLRLGTIALLPGVMPAARDNSVSLRLGARSAVARYLRSRRTWGLDRDLSAEEGERLVHALVEALRGHLINVVESKGRPYGIRLRVDALRWRPGDGRPPAPDPVRAKSLHLLRRELRPTEPNRYFVRLYRERAPALAGLLSAEHTGQVASDLRIKREDDFRAGKLPLLFCSPTMELGVDISDLAVVHLRNLPPTPANYAQRSGRAGRGGRPALVAAFSSYGNAHDHYFFRKKREMIAGAVAPPRIDLANKELLEAHLHSVWLSVTGIGLKGSITEVLDLEQGGYPLLPEMSARIDEARSRVGEVIEAFAHVRDMVRDEVRKAGWFTQAWLDDVARSSPSAFDAAFTRWRELYRTATEQRDAARRIIDAPRVDRRERERAEQREREAKREIDLLVNRAGRAETDFYTYRYLANEGFIPGYNFPRLPVRALVSTATEAQSIDRPRFIGLSEFGPWNVIYHEGRKHRVVSCVLPSGGIEGRLTRAKLCQVCGHLHPRDDAAVDLCRHCGTRLDGRTSDYPQALLEQPTVRASRWVRISSEEEDRVREGYHLTTHFHLTGADPATVLLLDRQDAPVLEIRHAPQADLWRINHGWRRSAQRNGFVIDGNTGWWERREDGDEEDPDDPRASAPIAGVKPYVRDRRNILLLRPMQDDTLADDFLKTLAHGLRRAIQLVYQVEEQEVCVETIGRDAHRRILLWEAAEGGIGVWERLVETPTSFEELAREALRLCHFQPETGEPDPAWSERCTAACYDCLLSYSNQPDHRLLNRFLLREYLMRLATAKVAPEAGRRSYEEQYRWLRERTDPASSFERDLLDELYRRRLRLPDHAQYCPASNVLVQPDFYYERGSVPGICIFIDGPAHDSTAQSERDRQARDALADRGYRVIAIVAGRPLGEQLVEQADVFTPA